MNGLADYYEFRGQLARSIEYVEKSLQETARLEPALVVAMTQLRALGLYVRAGRPETAQRTLQRIKARLQPPYDKLVALGETELHLELEAADEAERAAARLEQSIQALGFQLLRSNLVNARGRIAERPKDWSRDRRPIGWRRCCSTRSAWRCGSPRRSSTPN